VSLEPWHKYISRLRADFDAQPPCGLHDFFRLFGRFREFVADLPAGDRIPTLIFAYQRYQECGESKCPDRDRYFWNSAYSILISSLLSARLAPSKLEACAILQNAFHYCGHGSDVLPPVKLAERTFRSQPYSTELFDAARMYRERLRPLRAVSVQSAKQRLDLLLWHDLRYPVRGCWTNRIQLAIHGMTDREALAWQWLLRHTVPGSRSSLQAQQWSEEARSRLDRLGEDRFLARLDEWFVFSDEERVRLSTAGSHMLRQLVLYSAVMERRRSSPIVARLANVRWSKEDWMTKTADALARVTSPD
jgi:hypothetical protein